jgi:hypothetical protein
METIEFKQAAKWVKLTGNSFVTLRLKAKFPVRANLGVRFLRKKTKSAQQWTVMGTAILDNDNSTAPPPEMTVSVQNGFVYAFDFQGAAKALMPGANQAAVEISIHGASGAVLENFGGPKTANSSAAVLFGAAFFEKP